MVNNIIFHTIAKDFQMYKLDLEKAKEPEIKLPAFVGSWRSKEVPEKHLPLLH